MNVKQFKRRWVNSKVEPELFYMSVPKKENLDSMIFEIEVYNCEEKLDILMINNLNYGLFPDLQLHILYNLRDLNGNLITPKDNPELFTNNPLNTELLQEDLVEYNKAVQLIVDWGDGEQTVLKGRETKFKGKYLYDSINGSQISHSYKKNGKYTIFVSGVCSQINIVNSKYINGTFLYNKDKGWEVKKVISFGNLNNTALNNTYSAAIIDKAEIQCYLNFSSLKKVRKINYLVYDPKNIKGDLALEKYFENSPIASWDIIGGDNFFHHFPKLVDATSAMYCSNTPYVPNYCFSDNPYLLSLRTCFAYNPIKYIGKYACANLKYLVDIQTFCSAGFLVQGNNYEEIINIWDKYIGCIPYIDNGLFENCISLNKNTNIYFNYFQYKFKNTSISNIWGNNYYNMDMCGKIGDKIFKNCKLINGFVMYDTFLLNSIGNEVFANCIQLQKVSFYGGTPCLEHIGENIFENCKNIFRVDFNIPLNAAIPLEITDNFLSDIEFQNGVKYYFRDMRIQYAGYHSINYENKGQSDIRKKDLFSFLTYMNNPYSNEIPIKLSIEFIKKYQPNIYKQLEEIKNTFPNKYYIKFGKNMFNEKFIKQWFDSCKNYVDPSWVLETSLPLWYGQCYELYISENQTEWYNVCCGEAPPFWKYISPEYRINESSYYGQNYESYNNKTILPVHYDNLSEIPYLYYDSNGGIPMNGFNGIGYYDYHYKN